MATRREILRKLDSLEPRIARAFREAIEQIRSDANLTQLAEAIRLADVDAAMQAAGINNAAFVPLTEATRSIYVESGHFYAKQTPKSIKFGFNVNNPRAERWIRENSAERVQILRGEQRDVIQASIRETVERGIAAGANPKQTALDLAGRIDRRTGRRVGGKIGLNSRQAQWVRNARQELRSGSRVMMNNYLSRTRRDRRFDSIVKRAMKAGEGLSEQDISRITGRYSDRLLQTRAETIARTETNKAFQEAADESLRQLVDEGHVREENVRKIWDATMDQNTRPTHAAANGQVVGMNEPFTVGGFPMMHPLDGSLGAPGSEIIDCRCFVRQDINYITEEAARG